MLDQAIRIGSCRHARTLRCRECLERLQGATSQRSRGRKRIEVGIRRLVLGHVTASPLEREQLFIDCRKPERLRLRLVNYDIRYDATAAIHRPARSRATRRTACGVPFGPREAIVLPRGKTAVVALNH